MGKHLVLLCRRGFGIQDVQPIRVIWRGDSGHAFLVFTDEDTCDAALDVMKDFEINGKTLRSEKSIRKKYVRQRRRRDGSAEGGEGGGDSESENYRRERPPPRRRYRQRRNFRRPRSEDRDGENEDGRPSDGRNTLPAIYLGGIPRSLKVSEMKARIRERDVAPLRVIWRGDSGHAFLVFQDMDTCEAALDCLKDFEINGKPMRAEMSNRSGGGGGGRGGGGKGDNYGEYEGGSGYSGEVD